MKKILFLPALTLTVQLLCAQHYWQQEVNYTINVSLLEKARALKGDISMQYINHSPDTLRFAWIHLWPNAYKNTGTALYRQLAADAGAKEKLKNVSEKGYIDSLSFTVDGIAATTEAHPEHIDIIKLLFPAPLPPGSSIRIATPFYTKLPGYFSRMGYTGDYFMVSQWYPKPAVYDRRGWHPMPYLDQGEFYSEFGSFDVSITLPAGYVVAATGNLQTAAELEALKTSGSYNRRVLDSVLAKTKKEDLEIAINRLDLQHPSSIYQPGTKTLRFTESQVHDFAWFACRDFYVQYDTLSRNGSSIDVFTFHHPESSSSWYNSSHFVKDAVTYYSGRLGPYAYKTVKAVEGPKNQSSGGMEYPTVTLITSPGASQPALDAVITHEVGHNWLYGMLASNEREHPWLDEGINTYIEFGYEAEKYRTNAIFGDNLPKEFRNMPLNEFLANIYSIINNDAPLDEPIETPAYQFTSRDSYALAVYLKPALWLYLLEAAAGRQEVDKALRNYFSRWKFRHPGPDDFKAALRESMPAKNLEPHFELLNKKGKLR